MSVIDDLVATSENLSDIRRSLISAIPCNDLDRSELSRLDFSSLLRVYIAWVDRHIEAKPRIPVFSSGFWTAPARDFATSIVAIARLSETGGDLRPYLSRRIWTDGYCPTVKNRRGVVTGGKDRALNAYGVHHLHLVPQTLGRRRSGESKALIFARLTNRWMTFIHFGGHGSFDDGTLRHAVAMHDVQSGNHVRGINGVTPDITAREGEDLLRRGINTMAVVDGRVALPGTLSSALTSVDHQIHVDQMVDILEEWEPQIRTAEGRRNLCDQYQVPFYGEEGFGWSIKFASLLLVDIKSRNAVFQLRWKR